MRIVSRGDFDSLVCSVLLSEVHPIGEIRFVHPKDAQDQKATADRDDIVVNIPYITGCGLWFDHHVSEEGKLPDLPRFEGRFAMAPSCARVVYDHYKGKHAAELDRFRDMLEAADRLDSAQLTLEDITRPSGWILLGLTIDPRSGLGPDFEKYFRWLIEYVKELPIGKVLEHPEVRRRANRVLEEQAAFLALLKRTSRQDGNVIVTDFRGLKEKPVGNRFLVYTLFPAANVELRVFDGRAGNVIAAVGHSIFNRTCPVNVGEFLKGYGGGGHRGAGTAQFAKEAADARIAEILGKLKESRATA